MKIESELETRHSEPGTRNSELGTSSSPWSALEALPGLNAVPAVWREKMGDEFETFSRAFLVPHPEPAAGYPCRKCGCAHDITIYAPDDIVAVCACEPWNCQNLILTAADIQILELNWVRLAHALCRAFGLNAKPAELGLYNTRQIGSWSADAVPVIFTIQHEPYDLNYVIMALATRLRRKFILLGPTTANLDATCQESLASVGAEFFSLETTVTITDQGNFQPKRLPGEIFAHFRPEPTDTEQMLRNAVMLVKAADAQQGARKVTLYMVMRLYCFDLLSARKIARTCGCSKTTIYDRLVELRAKLGRDPAEFRIYASQFEAMEKTLSDPRAESIYRKGAING